MTDSPIADQLEKLGVAFSRGQTEPVVKTKSVFLVDKKKKFFVVTLPESQEIFGIAPALASPLLAIKKPQNVSFACDEALKEGNLSLGSTVDSVPPIVIKATDLEVAITKCECDFGWVNLDVAAETSSPERSGGKSASKGSFQQQQQSSKESQSQQQQQVEVSGITVKKHEKFSEWYSQVTLKGELLEYYDIPGCFIMRPCAYFMWECIQEYMNKEIKKMGVRNCYFPMFVSGSKLQSEKEHVEGFSPEVAWVTKYGESDLADPIAIRPTSETIMYPAFSKWVRSHRDLPLKLNQWCPVVRWEFKQATPFIRTREFLWQEGHTVHVKEEEAYAQVLDALNLYSKVYKDLLAIPVIPGVKSENEKFAGALKTLTIETIIEANGRSVQAATSHHLGQNFSKMFAIEFEDKDRNKQFAYQTSWGLSTRSLGVTIMVHGDDKGLVLPPRVSPIQIVIVPIIYKDQDRESLLTYCETIKSLLESRELRVYLDDRENYTPGWKYNHWEIKGVCLRLEVGPRDLENKRTRAVRRDTGLKQDININKDFDQIIVNLLNEIHNNLYNKALKVLNDSVIKITDWEEVVPVLNNKKLILAPWCEDPLTEDQMKAETTRLFQNALNEANTSDDPTVTAPALTGAMKALCLPLDQPPMPKGQRCFFAKDRLAKRWCIFGRSY